MECFQCQTPWRVGNELWHWLPRGFHFCSDRDHREGSGAGRRRTAAQVNVSIEGLLRQVPDGELKEEMSCGEVICWRSTGKEGKMGSLEWRPRLYSSHTPWSRRRRHRGTMRPWPRGCGTAAPGGNAGGASPRVRQPVGW